MNTYFAEVVYLEKVIVSSASSVTLGRPPSRDPDVNPERSEAPECWLLFPTFPSRQGLLNLAQRTLPAVTSN